jgi:hypothetical protein
MCLVFLGFFIAILAVIVAQHPHRSREIFYSVTHHSWDDYYNLQNAIRGKGADVCDIPVSLRLYPACETATVIFGRSGVPYLRAIIETGTRVATMDRYCNEFIFPKGDFEFNCLDESWFHESSAAHYDYNIDRPKLVFNAKKHVFLIRDPFDSVIDLYYRRHWSRRPLNLYKGDPMSTFSDHKDLMTFAVKEFAQWNEFINKAKNFTLDDYNDFEIFWYDELDSDILWRNTTTRLFEYLRDGEYFPTVEQSLRCIDRSNIEDGPSYIKVLPSRDKIFTADDRKVLCPMVDENWEQERWGDFCLSA